VKNVGFVSVELGTKLEPIILNNVEEGRNMSQLKVVMTLIICNNEDVWI